ncbi:hypothetical protein OG241_09265 [Streptomyces sp. NBC_01390]
MARIDVPPGPDPARAARRPPVTGWRGRKHDSLWGLSKERVTAVVGATRRWAKLKNRSSNRAA